jgi:hypothetical protein
MNDIRTDALLLSTLKALEHVNSLATEHTGREAFLVLFRYDSQLAATLLATEQSVLAKP